MQQTHHIFGDEERQGSPGSTGTKEGTKRQRGSTKRDWDFGYHWHRLSPCAQRRAEESALLGWDNPDLDAFRREFQLVVASKARAVRDWCVPMGRMALETGLVLDRSMVTEMFADGAMEGDHRFQRLVLALPAYREYVLRCAVPRR